MHPKGTILLIDDDPDDREIMRDVFADLQLKTPIEFFSSCSEAYTYLMSVKEKPFIIFCDINLPKMNGIELKRKIDSTDHLRRKSIPFVFLTTSDEASLVEEAYRGTCLQGYFKKRNSMKEITEQVRCILYYWIHAEHPSLP